MSGHPEDKNSLRSFGFLMGGVFSIIAAIFFYKERMTVFTVFGGIAGLVFFSALVRPRFLENVYVWWMKFAHVVGLLNSKVILSLMYTIIFTLFRAFLFVLRKDLLHRKFDSSLDSYWSDYEQIDNDPKRYEKQF